MARQFAGFLVAGSLVIACSGSGSTSASVPIPSGEARNVPTVAPSASQPAPAAPSRSTSTETWDLLWLSDSTGSAGTPWQYADHIRQDAGVEVDVTDGWTMGLGAGIILDTLRGRNDGMLHAYSGAIDLATEIREAEVIMVSGSPASLLPEDHVYCATAPEPSPKCSPQPDACGPEMWKAYEETLQAIFDEIFRIRGGEPVILRTHDSYLPWGPAAVWKACDCVELCLECGRQMSAAIHRAAASRGVPVADYLTTFSGPDGDQIMPEGWTPDGVHPTVEASAELAKVMAGLGYEPVAPTQ
jgi:hypothetical protein